MQDDYAYDSDYAPDSPVAKVSQYTESLKNTGVADQGFPWALLLSFIKEWINKIKRRTGLNVLIQWWRSRNIPPECVEGLRWAERTDALYRLLAARHHSKKENGSSHCPKKEHETLLRLLSDGDSEEVETDFQLFLTSCSDDGWQRAICSFETLVFTSPRF